MKMFYIFCLTATLFSVFSFSVSQDVNLKSFSHAIKNGQMKGGNVENILFEYSAGPGVITEQWFTGIIHHILG